MRKDTKEPGRKQSESVSSVSDMSQKRGEAMQEQPQIVPADDEVVIHIEPEGHIRGIEMAQRFEAVEEADASSLFVGNRVQLNSDAKSIEAEQLLMSVDENK